MTERVKLDDLVTLHYRVATADDIEIVSTFGATPATLQLGSGELAPTLEACLDGLPVGERHVFLLEAHQAFGPHNPELMKRIPKAELPNGGADIGVLTLVEFAAPNGQTFAGLVREMDDETALVDFNHPLAGKSIRFEVEVIGVL
ncbi:FKBP-type peptidyl-prolyl cis-trans isomerase [Sulfuricystis multivorans]|uniref:FKBP-type peptidyl-prolyl cis-trans isomerase n=1 Tax=Sulfuricystis multivorans TaxID=2211108 RepID=UPI000F8186B2|nr:FKBP-type peptidyl-prolyl cis-trans isomerase [Sulfuricystis multivorans]